MYLRRLLLFGCLKYPPREQIQTSIHTSLYSFAARSSLIICSTHQDHHHLSMLTFIYCFLIFPFPYFFVCTSSFLASSAHLSSAMFQSCTMTIKYTAWGTAKRSLEVRAWEANFGYEFTISKTRPGPRDFQDTRSGFIDAPRGTTINAKLVKP